MNVASTVSFVWDTKPDFPSEWTQNEFKSIFFIQKKGKHKEVSNNKSQPQMIKLGYEMEVYIVTHDDGWGLVASNKRFLGQTKLV